MKERPIPFTAAMIRAIRRKVNPKTVTRRLVKAPRMVARGDDGKPCGASMMFDLDRAWADRGFPNDKGEYRNGYLHVPFAHPQTGWEKNPRQDTQWRVYCPYGHPGDALWVRESYRFGAEWDDTKPSEVPQSGLDLGDVYYEADGLMKRPEDNGWGKLRPGMFMPRWASRLTLEVVSVRAERVQEITEADAIAEGVEAIECAECGGSGRDPDVGECPFCRRGTSHRQGFLRLFYDLNERAPRTENPHVWRIEFREIGGAQC